VKQQGVLNVNGKCLWFDKTRGFGFLTTESGDVFVHASGVLFGLQLEQATKYNSKLCRIRKAADKKLLM
jgi:hypothetical protein